METSSSLLQDRTGHVLVLTLNRPEARNALDPTLLQQLGNAFRLAADEDDIRAVVITGAGFKAFCAGMDLRAFAESRKAGSEPVRFDSLLWVYRGGFPKPLIAAVNGPAVAGGLELVLAADLVVTADHATFGISEVKRGMFAAGGGTTLSARIPLAVALEMGLTGDPIDAHRAYAMGLVNRVEPPEHVLDIARGLAETIAANGPLAVQTTKRLLRDAALDPHRGWPSDDDVGRVFTSRDAAEGAAAFVEKRAPRWTGR